jgi:hypothetical protein
MSLPLALSKDNRWMNDERRGQPSEMAMDVLEEASGIERHSRAIRYTRAVSDCAVHPGVSATSSCGSCSKVCCDECLAYDVDGIRTCNRCGRRQAERSSALASAVLFCVATAYLATLAIGYSLFRARPFVGGLSAVVAIVFGRLLHTNLTFPAVTRRTSEPRIG